MLPLFDEAVVPPTWNERMVDGEHAVHSSSYSRAGAPYCTVWTSLPAAEAHAREQVAARPETACRIYDARGFAGQPVREIRGAAFKVSGEISARFRRWVGLGLFVGGIGLIVWDWSLDFRLTWPGTIGMRIMFPGMVLLGTEAALVFTARRRDAGAIEGRGL